LDSKFYHHGEIQGFNFFVEIEKNKEVLYVVPFLSYLIKVAEQFFHQNNWSPNLNLHYWLGAEVHFLCRIPTSSFGQRGYKLGLGKDLRV
jgi:hypothetical protein